MAEGIFRLFALFSDFYVLRAFIKSLSLRGRFPRRAAAVSDREFLRAMACFEEGRTGEAEDLALTLEKNLETRHYAFYLQSLIAVCRGLPLLALSHILAAIDVKPMEPVYWLRAAEMDFALEDFKSSAARYEQLLALPDQPFGADSHLLFAAAAAMDRSGKAFRAIELLEQAVAIRPDFPEARTNLAMLLQLAGDSAGAHAHMDHVLLSAPTPSARLRRALMLSLVPASNADIAATRETFSQELDALLAMPRIEFPDPHREIGLTAFALAYHGLNDVDLMRKLARVIRRGYSAAAKSLDRMPKRRPAPGGRIRVGFVSTHFYSHSIGRAFHGYIHDLPRERFETWVFAIAPNRDAWAETLRTSSEHYVLLADDLDAARIAIESAQLDVLIFTDLGMHPTTYFLAFWRIAPIQMALWGHPVTSGIDTVDYYVSSSQIESAAAQAHYSETLLRLDGYFLPRYARPSMEGAGKSRSALGLSEHTHIYQCPQTLFKMHPDFDFALRSILDQDDKAEIHLRESTPQQTRAIRQRFEHTLAPHAARVRFIGPVSNGDFLSRMAAADAVLDPFYFGGCNSSAEAFSVGAPLVCLPGSHLGGRFTLGLYKEMGMEASVTRSKEEYVALALRLGRNADFRADFRAKITERAAVLFERPDAGRHLGSELIKVVEALP